jgi:hypothetical protein
MLLVTLQTLIIFGAVMVGHGNSLFCLLNWWFVNTMCSLALTSALLTGDSGLYQ